jgi:amino acid adenylation domain-containing protein
MLVQHFLEASTERHPGKTALVCGPRRVTYAELYAMAEAMALRLRAQGVRAGDRVAIWMESSPEAVAAIFAVLETGAAFVPLHPQTKPAKVVTILRDCEARTIVAPEEWVTAEIRGACAESPSARTDLAAILYTSGSTGVPRGVMLSHGNIVAASASIIEYLDNREDDVVLDFLPLSFDYGLYNVLMPLRFGGTVVLERGFIAPHQILGLLQRERIAGLPLVPTIAAGLAQLRSLGPLELPHLRYITSTGQALAPAHIERLGRIFPGARIFSMYGLTECKRATYLPPEELARRPASVGIPIPGTEAWIGDAAGNRIDRAGVDGELVIRGPHVMQGYWNRPDETARALRPGPLPGERVLYTGDRFRMDDEGFLYFVARMDDMIKTSGQLVSPKEIENAVLALEGVEEAVAYGRPDEILGQSIHLVVRTGAEAALTAADVVAWCAARLEKWMVPRSVDVRRELPRTTTGKTARREIAAPLIGG